jgi:hypothetical protein
MKRELATEEQVKRFLGQRGHRLKNDAPGDQSVYVYLGSVMIDHFPPNVVWYLREVKDQHGGVTGIAQDVFEVKPDGRSLRIRSYEPGQWTYIGRGHPNT